MSMELIWPYVKSHPIPSVEGYLSWVKEQENSLYQIKFEQIFIYLQASINYRKGIRENNLLLKRAAKRAFSPIWSARRHPIYRQIEIANEIQLLQLDPVVREIIEKNCVVSRSGLFNQHQGLDAILEEINKALKTLIPPVLQMRYWQIAARNCKKFLQPRNNFFNLIGYNDLQTTSPRNWPEAITECQRFRARLRKDNFINPAMGLKTIYKSLREKYKLTPLFKPIPITKQEAMMQTSEATMTNGKIDRKIEGLLEHADENIKKNYRRIKSKKCNELLIILKEVRSLNNSSNNIESLENAESEVEYTN
ncbi:hypothetical protein C2G38_2180125 [Gigaspora rosea]|uniref:Uncharacterized protein n=1 Tax=Gigaspora rosea TaxID=44941 RepID=A0A397VGH8_9GLOM|nr:hypothetical protein C2G38_2180125 [Gigaspora rosea]